MSKLQTMTKDEILELDHRLRQCAQLVMEPYLNIDINIRKKQQAETESLRQLLENIESYQKAFSVYYKMRFPERAKKDLELRTGAIGDNVNDLFLLLKEDEISRPEMGILFPVSIYVLIMNNCFNKYAIERENQRIKEELQNRNEEIKKKNDQNGAYKALTSKEFKYEDVFADMFKFSVRDLCSITRTISEEKGDDFTAYDKVCFALVVANKRIFRKMQRNSSKAILPKVLRNYREIALAIDLTYDHKRLIYYGESAQAGLLLKEILQVNMETDKPLDRVLRLYIANEIDQILMRTGVMNGLPADVFLDVDTDNGLLKWYCEQINIFSSENRVNDYIEYVHQWDVILKRAQDINNSDASEQQITQECYKDDEDNSLNYNGASFCSLYQDLDENCPFSKEDADNMLNFYLSADVIGKKGDVRHSALLYIRRLLSVFRGKGNRYLKELSGSRYIYHQNIIQACGYENQVQKIRETLAALFEKAEISENSENTTN